MDQATPEVPLLVEETDRMNPPAPPKSKKGVILLSVAGVLILALLILGIVFLARSPADTTARVRDIFIIFMALESLVIGAALVILIVQVAILINLLNNEVRPIITSTNQTVNTLKGTVQFLSDNLSEPVIKMNETLAGLRKFFDIIRPSRR